MQVIDKKEPETEVFDEITRLQEEQEALDEAMSAEQEEGTIAFYDEEGYIGIAFIGDMHLGSEYTHHRLMKQHFLKIINTKNMYAVQLGDITSSEAMLSNRMKAQRNIPKEASPSAQMNAAKEMFWMIGDKLLAYNKGNHDRRFILNVGFDFCAGLAKLIRGVYLGYRGVLNIDFTSGVSYKIYLSHYPKGRATYDPTRGGYAYYKEDPSLDIVAFGHIHTLPAQGDRPSIRGEVIQIRSGGYMLKQGDYEKNAGFAKASGLPICPMVILNPKTREIIYFRDMYRGIEFLELLNHKDDDMVTMTKEEFDDMYRIGHEAMGQNMTDAIKIKELQQEIERLNDFIKDEELDI